MKLKRRRRNPRRKFGTYEISILCLSNLLHDRSPFDDLPKNTPGAFVGVRPTPEQPLVAILTQPVPDDKRKAGFDFDEYILAINHQFISLSGARPVYISYYLGETEEGRKRLHEILE